MQRQRRRILLLGASAPQIPSILEARRQGLYVITCDNRPDNPGHALADEWHEVSTVDREAVLALAQRCRVDGVLCYMSDVSAPTAAYVCERMGFPTHPYESVRILTDKGLFRAFLREHGFHAPQSAAFGKGEEAAAMAYAGTLGFPCVVKPVDSSGSKGVRILREAAQLQDAIAEAYGYSIAKRIIVEQFIDCAGNQLSGEAFSVEGELRFFLLDDQYPGSEPPFDLTPVYNEWPCRLPEAQQEAIRAEVQRVLTLLGMRTGAYNIEARVDRQGRVWLMEVAPRNGGNMLPQLIRLATGVDGVAYMVKAAMGDSCEGLRQAPVRNHWALRVLYSRKDGAFAGVAYDEARRAHLRAEHLFVAPGDPVHAMRNGGQTVGIAFFEFDSHEALRETMRTADARIRVLLREDGPQG